MVFDPDYRHRGGDSARDVPHVLDKRRTVRVVDERHESDVIGELNVQPARHRHGPRVMLLLAKEIAVGGYGVIRRFVTLTINLMRRFRACRDPGGRP
jgi:hypothetical protein